MADASQNKGLTTTHKILISGFVVVIAVVVGLFFYFNRPQPEAVANTVPEVINEATFTEIEETVTEQLAKTNFQVMMTTDWYFPSGSEASTTATVANSSHNNYPFYFTVTLADTDEEIYKSGLIPLGKSLDTIVLDKSLPAGVHEGLLVYHLIDDQNNNAEIPSSLKFKLKITVLS